MNKGMLMSLIRLGCELEFCRIVIYLVRMELREAVSRVGPEVKERLEVEWFGRKMGEDIKGMSRNSIGEVRDNSEAVPHFRGFIGRCIGRWGGVRKSGGGVRM